METIFRLKLILHICGELHRSLMGERNVGALLQNMDNASYLEWINNNFPDLFFQLSLEVLPAARIFESEKETLKALEQELDKQLTEHQEASGTIKAKNFWLEKEMAGIIPALIFGAGKTTYRLFEEGQRRFLLQHGNKEQRYLLYVVSAGLGVLNFVALCELLSISFDRLTFEMLIFVPFGLCFSAAAMLAVNLGLSEFIKATRNYTVRGDTSLHDNLFPHGWKDKAIWLSVLILCADGLFSSVGLMLALPPGVRDELFWQVSIVAVSCFASLVNIVLTWGVTLHRVLISLRFKHEGATQHHEIEQLEAQIQSVMVSKAKLKKIRLAIKRQRHTLIRAERAALTSYRRWFKALQACQSEQRIIEHQQRFFNGSAHAVKPDTPTLNGKTQRLTLPPIEHTDSNTL